MTETGGAEEHYCVEHFRTWLRSLRMTGCQFASSFASQGSAMRIAYYVRAGVPGADDVPGLDATIESNARAGRFVVAIFPHVRTVEEIGALLLALDANGRWGCSHVPWHKHERTDTSLIGVTWRTDGGLRSSVMGFAPLGVMPITRRAPLVALALWPGGLVNNLRRGKAKPGTVGLVDGVHGLDPDPHMAAWDETRNRVVSLFEDPAEDRETLREVAFCLPRDSAQRLRFKDASEPAPLVPRPSESDDVARPRDADNDKPRTC